MEINTLSARLDQKLSELDQRLQQLTAAQNEAVSADEKTKIAADIDTLGLMKEKLIKSRDIAWRAHNLQQDHNELESLQRKRRIALALCVVSAIGALMLLGIFLWM